jgi:tryptophan synthase beta chain
MRKNTKILLNENDMPRQWYNILHDIPKPLDPPLHPGTKQPAGPDDLKAIFPMSLILQEVSTAEFIDIPDEVLDIYSLWRPTPMHRAYNLEKALGTPARIYYKDESVSPAGSHKPNTAVPQAYYNKKEGIKRIATETGAGQWGSALSFAGALFGIEIQVYMVRVSFDQKPYRKFLMQSWGGKCVASPSELTNTGRAALKADPNNPGSLGLAISEAIEDAATKKDTNYSLGSVLNHVLLHQSIIGLEAKKQIESIGEYPDVVIGCAGGGSNFAGIATPFIRDKINGKKIDILAVEPSSCPSLTKGMFRYDFGDVGKTTPLLKMHTLGHSFMPPSIHAGGLRYHGMAPIVSSLVHQKIVEARAYHQNATFEAGILFARTEGILPAPETTHAIKAAIDEALKAKAEGKEKTILFNFSGHGHFDLGAYDKYLNKELTDYEYPSDAIQAALKELDSIGVS